MKKAIQWLWTIQTVIPQQNNAGSIPLSPSQDLVCASLSTDSSLVAATVRGRRIESWFFSLI